MPAFGWVGRLSWGARRQHDGMCVGVLRKSG